MSQINNGENLRNEIDTGKSRDKVDFPDPATVPLATDAEAGGATAPLPSEDRGGAGHKDSAAGFWIYALIIGAIALIALVLVWFGTGIS